MRAKKLLSLSLLAASISGTNSYAAPVISRDTIPGSIQPGLIGQQFPKAPTLKAPVNLPLVAKTPTTALPPAAQKIKFKLEKLVITGNTVYQQNQLANIYKNYLGQTISLVDLQMIADNITKRYREDGYLLSKAIIPAQKIANGLVTIQVIEGYIANVTIAENKPFGGRHLLEAYTKHLTEYHPINIAMLERYILLANDIPGVDVRAVLSPAQNTATTTVGPGATQATFIPDERKINAYLTYDNRGTVYLGPFQWSFGASINSVFRSGDQTNVQGLITTNSNELQFYRLSHQTPIGSNGLVLNLATSYNASQPGSTLAQLNIIGRSFANSIGLSYPLIRSRSESLFLTGTFDTSRNVSNILSNTIYIDKLRSLRFGGTYSKTDSWYGVNQVGTQISKGLQVFGASKNNQTDEEGVSTLSRKDGRSDYSKLNLDLSRLQFIGGSNFSILGALQGQYAFTPLLIAEQFTYGGSQFGLAYDPAQFTGDHGIAGKVELRYDSDPNWHFLKHIQYFTFYDIGKVWNKNGNTVGVPTNGSSLGVGFRTQVNQYLSAHLEWAKPLTAPAGGSAILSNNPRVFFGITVAGDSGNSLAATSMQPPAQIYQPLG